MVNAIRHFSLAWLFAVALLLVGNVQAGRPLSGQIISNQILSDISALGPNTKVTIDGGLLTTYVTLDGSFSFADVPEGNHILRVVSHLYSFDQVRVVVSSNGIMAYVSPAGTDWKRPGPPLLTPLSLPARGKYDFFVPREAFNFMSLLSNPMLLMSGVSMLLVFVLPKLSAAGADIAAADAAAQEPVEPTPQLELPDISQGLANFFAPKTPAKK
ncbi:uncharacterized protein EV422DRAFT_617002 [Fimicolochytrium jonesii]|uniref:uncharacterized protein n=1 Tax=Fimicolochytrium jonesii TaxID=1396493 RepID=UPI0022FEBCAC|nr:uncharacterized protein EV422DRAFT_617002 [Fimicolochytrium jonesii]KAI8825984.1 hypothetical protein EV422DRAFT_617002 [Fimicolochytrium jonesii]